MLLIQRKDNLQHKIDSIIQAIMCRKQVASVNPSLGNGSHVFFGWATVPFHILGEQCNSFGPKILGLLQLLSKDSLDHSLGIEHDFDFGKLPSVDLVPFLPFEIIDEMNL